MNKPLENEKAPPPLPDSVRPAVYYMPAELPQEDEINLVDLWRVLLRYKTLILAITAVSTLLSILYAFVSDPVYRAEALLVPMQQDEGGRSALAGQFGDIAALAGINLGKGGGNKEQALAILQSRNFTRRFIEAEHLLPAMFAKQWDAGGGVWRNGHPPDAWNAYKMFQSMRSVSEDKKTGLIRLAIEWSDPQQAALWVNALVKRLNDDMRQQTIAESEKSIAYLNDQLLKTGVVDLQQSIYRLIESQIKNIMLANSRDEFAFKVIDAAVVPQERVRPNRKMIVILGVMVGLISAVFSAFAWSWISNLREEAGYQKP